MTWETYLIWLPVVPHFSPFPATDLTLLQVHWPSRLFLTIFAKHTPTSGLLHWSFLLLRMIPFSPICFVWLPLSFHWYHAGFPWLPYLAKHSLLAAYTFTCNMAPHAKMQESWEQEILCSLLYPQCQNSLRHWRDIQLVYIEWISEWMDGEMSLSLLLFPSYPDN